MTVISRILKTVAVVAGLALPAGMAVAQPTGSKVFNPSTIGPGNTSQITFTISNGAASPVTDIAFTDVLPAATTFDAYAQVPLGRKLALVLRGENLTDEDVVTRNQGGSIDLGVPRTLWAGLKVGL